MPLIHVWHVFQNKVVARQQTKAYKLRQMGDIVQSFAYHPTNNV